MKLEEILKARVSNADNEERVLDISANLEKGRNGMTDSLTDGTVNDLQGEGQLTATFSRYSGGSIRFEITDSSVSSERQIEVFAAVQAFITDVEAQDLAEED